MYQTISRGGRIYLYRVVSVTNVRTAMYFIASYPVGADR